MSDPLRTEDGKFYRWPPAPAEDFKLYERVTHLLGSGVPQHWMKPWVAKLISEHVAANFWELGSYFVSTHGAEGTQRRRDDGIKFLKSLPDQKRDTAGARGTAVHELAETLAHGEEASVPDELVAHVDNYLAFLDAVQPDVVMTEGTVFNDQYGYAGRFDLVAYVNGELAMIDLKTSASGAKPEVALQLGAYCHPNNFIGYPDGTNEAMPTIGAGYVLSVTDAQWAFIPVDVDLGMKFLPHVIGVANWCTDIAKTVLGTPIAGTK